MRTIVTPLNRAIAIAARRVRRLVDCRRGASAVEFALVSPVVFLLILGAAYVGILIGSTHSLSQMAADAARHAMAGLDATERRAMAVDLVERQMTGYVLVRPDRVDVKVFEKDGFLTVTVKHDVTWVPTPPIVSAVMDYPTEVVRASTVKLP